MSTGNPAFDQYGLYAPLFEAMADGRRASVVHWLRLNRYFTATDTSHLDEHERAFAALGVDAPPILFGELGAVRSYAEPEAGYLAMQGFSDDAYLDRLKSVKYPSALYCYGVGIYDTRWQWFALSDDLVRRMAQELPRTDKSAYEEWSAAMPPEAPDLTPVSAVARLQGAVRVNVRSAPTTASTPVSVLSDGQRVTVVSGEVEGGEYRVNGVRHTAWRELTAPVAGYVASAYVQFDVVPEVDPLAAVREQLAVVEREVARLRGIVGA
jgi:hypothetical protein